ncbi:MAG: DNA polymerase III subunit gamma/tau [Proteobacteria bacterium]|nr:DNA polymerase III subunit gamma/tau [Pseudomonadota bacterium]
MSDNYTVLARKYRSQDFATLIGQDVLVKTLTTAIKTGRIAHAYIFTGIRGTGKTSTARILAKALNCLSSDGPTASPCGTCENCRAIAAGQHIDVMEIDAASHTQVDYMRELLETAQYRPTNSRYKVYIIDEVHMLSTSSFNALLKTLEEPPSHVIFILATTEIRKVPLTVLSRCQRFDLERVPIETLKKHFAWIADQEKIELSDEANELIARAADGSVRDGLSLLDQAIAQTGGHVDGNAVLDMLKRADRIVVLDFMQTLIAGNTPPNGISDSVGTRAAAALRKADELYQNGADLSLLLSDMMEWTHWITRMHPSLRLGDAVNAPYSADQRAAMQKIADGITLVTLSRLWQAMVAGVPEMQTAGNQKQCFDMLVVRLMNAVDSASAPTAAVQTPNQSGELRVESKDKKVENATPKPETVAKPSQLSTLNAKLSINSLSDLTAALTAAKEILLLTDLNNNTEVSEFGPGHIKFFNRKTGGDFAAKLSAWLQAHTGHAWHLEQTATSVHAPTAGEFEKNSITNDPMIAAAMGLFGGEIVMSNQ